MDSAPPTEIDIGATRIELTGGGPRAQQWARGLRDTFDMIVPEDVIEAIRKDAMNELALKLERELLKAF